MSYKPKVHLKWSSHATAHKTLGQKMQDLESGIAEARAAAREKQQKTVRTAANTARVYEQNLREIKYRCEVCEKAFREF